MRDISKMLMLAVAMSMGTSALAQNSESSGPKIHTTDTKDTSGCSKESQKGAGTVLGSTAGMLLGGHMRSATGVRLSAAAGKAAGQQIDTSARCDPKARVQGDQDETEAPKKKKIKLPGLGF